LAVDFGPTPEMVKTAIEAGTKAANDPESLFAGYEFGERGVGINGYVLTKFLEIAQHAAVKAKEGAPIDKAFIDAVLKKTYLTVSVYLVGPGPDHFKGVEIYLHQGLNPILPLEILRDPPQKICCDVAPNLYKQDLYTGFPEKKLDPKAMTAVVVKVMGREMRFPANFAQIR